MHLWNFGYHYKLKIHIQQNLVYSENILLTQGSSNYDQKKFNSLSILKINNYIEIL
jgi:hypothetical protein